MQAIQLTGQAGRLDKVLVELLPQESRATIQKLIKEGQVTVNGQVEKANFKLKGQETLAVGQLEIELPLEVEPEEMPLDIVYEDEALLVLNKPAGVVVHPSKGHPSGTLVNGLLYYLNGDLAVGSDPTRPGIVHRIDKDTSGLLVVAKTNQAHQRLSEQLGDRTMGRRYVALVNGVIKAPKGSIEVPLQRDPQNRLRWHASADGKYALTHFEVLESYDNATLVDLTLATGRTHQIRVHLEYIGHPIIGDPVYRQGLSGIKGRYTQLNDGQYLHAYGIHFVHPVTGEEMAFEVPLPTKFEQLMTELGQQ